MKSCNSSFCWGSRGPDAHARPAIWWRLVALGLLGLTAVPTRAQLAPLTITGPGSLPEGFEGSSYSQTFTAAGGTGLYSWTATGLPSGLGMSVAGLLGGTPAVGSHGAYQVKATVTDFGGGAASVVLPLMIAGGDQIIVFGALADRPLGTAPFTISASATSGLAVSFASLTPSVCTVSGATATLVALGLCTIQATQSGNKLYTAATP